VRFWKLMGAGYNSPADQRAQGLEAKAEGDRELRQLVDAVPQHIVVLAADGRRVHANQVALDYHGMTLEEFLSEVTPTKWVHPEDLERYLNLRQSGIQSGALWEAEIRLRKKDGQSRWFLIRAKPLRDERGGVLRWYLAGTDIEERRRRNGSYDSSSMLFLSTCALMEPMAPFSMRMIACSTTSD